MKLTPLLFGLSLAAASTGIAVAQDMKPPTIIQLTREWVKPGKSGMMHDKSEATFVSLVNRAKLQGHYLALNSMTGKSRALYMTRYPSFEAWESDNKAMAKNAALSAEFDRAAAADGELLDGMDSAVLIYNDELSFHPRPDFSHARYYELTSFHVRPGHDKEFREAVKMYKDACEKAGMDIHWGMYGLQYGGDSGTYIAFTHRASLAELDKEMAESKKIVDAMGGEEGMQKFDQLFSQASDTMRSELFSINPKQSYVDEATIKADADFWRPKAMAPKAQAATATKPAVVPKPASR